MDFSVEMRSGVALTNGCFDFGKLQLGRHHEIRFRLQNDGIIPATARCEILGPASNSNAEDGLENLVSVSDTVPHFSVICPSTVNLDSGKHYEFAARFHPCEVGEFSQPIRVYTLHNTFEDMQIELKGEGFVTDVCWDLMNQPGAGDSLLDLGGISPVDGGISPIALDDAPPREKPKIALPAPPDEFMCWINVLSDVGTARNSRRTGFFFFLCLGSRVFVNELGGGWHWQRVGSRENGFKHVNPHLTCSLNT